MEIAETIAYLKQVRNKDLLIRRTLTRCAELKFTLLPGAVRYDGDRVQTSPEDKTGDILARVADLEQSILGYRMEKAQLVMEIGDQIERLADDLEKTVLTEFYLGRVSMTRIAKDIGYSIQHTYRLRRRGITHLSEIL